jgi:hypothetical protein
MFKKIPVCNVLLNFMIKFRHTVADELWKFFAVTYVLKLTPWGKVLHKQVVAWLVSKFYVFFGT